jgi:uncharacterized damage-inducible protein DinB
MNMKMTDLFAAELEREAKPSRRVMEKVPAGREDWKPHDKSMPLGRLAQLVATMPSWVTMMVNQDELDIQPPGGSKFQPQALRTSAELVQAVEETTRAAREALAATTDEHLLTPWRLLVGGHVVQERPRHEMIRESINHLAHHRGQLTVYLRLNGAPVPSVYGPSADDASFA